MISDTFNPKYPQLSSMAQALWHLYLIIKDHQTHKFFYSLETLAERTGHTEKTIIKGNNELEKSNIISVEKSHRKVTNYTVLEKVKISNGDKSFSLHVESTPKPPNEPALVVESTPNSMYDLQPKSDFDGNSYIPSTNSLSINDYLSKPANKGLSTSTKQSDKNDSMIDSQEVEEGKKGQTDSELDDFRTIISLARNDQTLLINRLEPEKRKRFYKWKKDKDNA